MTETCGNLENDWNKIAENREMAKIRELKKSPKLEKLVTICFCELKPQTGFLTKDK